MKKLIVVFILAILNTNCNSYVEKKPTTQREYIVPEGHECSKRSQTNLLNTYLTDEQAAEALMAFQHAHEAEMRGDSFASDHYLEKTASVIESGVEQYVSECPQFGLSSEEELGGALGAAFAGLATLAAGIFTVGPQFLMGAIDLMAFGAKGTVITVCGAATVAVLGVNFCAPSTEVTEDYDGSDGSDDYDSSDGSDGSDDSDSSDDNAELLDIIEGLRTENEELKDKINSLLDKIDNLLEQTGGNQLCSDCY